MTDDTVALLVDQFNLLADEYSAEPASTLESAHLIAAHLQGAIANICTEKTAPRQKDMAALYRLLDENMQSSCSVEQQPVAALLVSLAAVLRFIKLFEGV